MAIKIYSRFKNKWKQTDETPSGNGIIYFSGNKTILRLNINNDIRNFINVKVGGNTLVDHYAIAGDNIKIGSNVKIGKNASIGCNTVIKNNITIGKFCIIGKNCKIYSHTIIRDHCHLGDNTIIGHHSYLQKHSVLKGENIYIPPGSTVFTGNDFTVYYDGYLDRYIYFNKKTDFKHIITDDSPYENYVKYLYNTLKKWRGDGKASTS